MINDKDTFTNIRIITQVIDHHHVRILMHNICHDIGVAKYWNQYPAVTVPAINNIAYVVSKVLPVRF